MGEYRIEVEIELSAKKQSRWKGIIDRYRNQQKKPHHWSLLHLWK